MALNRNLRNFEKYTLLALVAFCVAYVAYHKLNAVSTHDKVIESTPTFLANNVLKDSIIDYGMQFLGTPYVPGGCSKDGFDCSGFVYFVFSHFKIETPRSSADFENFGEEIPIENVQKGDLLLFLSPTRSVIGHIGIVSTPKGRESEFIHATSGRQMSVVISSAATKGYADRFVKAVRVLE